VIFEDIYKKEFATNLGTMNKFRKILKKFEDENMSEKISDRENELKLGYNYSFMPLNSKAFVYSKMRNDENFEMFLSSSQNVRGFFLKGIFDFFW
jgi:hypothetical protein